MPSLREPALIVQHPSAPVVLDPTIPPDPRHQRVVSRPDPEVPMRLTLADDDRPTPATISRARADQQRQRELFLASLRDEQIKARYRRIFAEEDDTRLLRAVQALADVISQYRYGCVADCLPTETRTTVLAAAKLVADLPEQV